MRRVSISQPVLDRACGSHQEWHRRVHGMIAIRSFKCILHVSADRLWTGRGIGGDAFPHTLWCQPGNQRVGVLPLAARG